MHLDEAWSRNKDRKPKVSRQRSVAIVTQRGAVRVTAVRTLLFSLSAGGRTNSQDPVEWQRSTVSADVSAPEKTRLPCKSSWPAEGVHHRRRHHPWVQPPIEVPGGPRSVFLILVKTTV